jgi:hypothetical protein
MPPYIDTVAGMFSANIMKMPGAPQSNTNGGVNNRNKVGGDKNVNNRGTARNPNRDDDLSKKKINSTFK